MQEPSEIPVVILAGGRGARFDHESLASPKPMIRVAGKPILQHIIDSLMLQGFREFIVLTGFLREQIDAHFGQCGILVAPWTYRCDSLGREILVRTVPTGEGDEVHTGLRLWRAREAIAGRRFVLTYGDGLSDVDMRAVLNQHEHSGAGVTLTAVRPPGRFGVVEFEDGTQCTLEEHVAVGWINGGFMVMEPEFIEQYIEGEFELESTALRELGACGCLHAYRHYGFWMCMDTRRDREQIERAVQMNGGKLPWIKK